MTKKTVKVKRLPAKHGEYKVGYKHPPKEHQFKPGQSGNPAGPPKRRTQLWVHFCSFMEMSEAELKAYKSKKSLSMSERTAIKLVENAAKGNYTGSQCLARYVIDREEGKPTEHLVVGGNENILSHEKCDEIREILRKNFEAAAHNKS